MQRLQVSASLILALTLAAAPRISAGQPAHSVFPPIGLADPSLGKAPAVQAPAAPAVVPAPAKTNPRQAPAPIPAPAKAPNPLAMAHKAPAPPLQIAVVELPIAPWQVDPQPENLPAERDPAYADGMKAMDEGRWKDAVTAFDKVAVAHGDRAEAALYWKAYSLEKLGRKDDAQAACTELQHAKPSSTWNRECVMLRLQNADVTRIVARAEEMKKEAEKLKDKSGVKVYSSAWPDGYPLAFDYQLADNYQDNVWVLSKDGPHDPADDIKLIALNSLMQQEPEKAIPALKAFILSSRPIELRRRALFILSRSKSPEAQSTLMEIANTKSDPQLQRVAVQTLATGRGKQAGPELLAIYRSSTDKGVKRAAISGLFIARDATDLVDLARNEKDLEMKREIVSQLALMHDAAATAYMEELLK